MTFSTRQQLEALERALKRVPLAHKSLRSAEMDLEEQILASLADRLRRALEREQRREHGE